MEKALSLSPRSVGPSFFIFSCSFSQFFAFSLVYFEQTHHQRRRRRKSNVQWMNTPAEFFFSTRSFSDLMRNNVLKIDLFLFFSFLRSKTSVLMFVFDPRAKFTLELMRNGNLPASGIEWCMCVCVVQLKRKKKEKDQRTIEQLELMTSILRLKRIFFFFI